MALAANSSDRADVTEKDRLKSSYNKYYEEYNNNKNNPRSIYNFAVINFKLGSYDLAKLLFKKLLNNKSMEQLAKYNLALVANRQSYIEESIYWFQRLLATAKLRTTETAAEKKLRQLAQIQLKKLKAEKIKISQSFSYNSYVLLKYGHDDNVIDPVGNVIDGDNYTNFYGLLTLNFDNVLSGFKWRFSYYLKDYSTYNGDDFDQLSTDFSIHYKYRRWRSFIRIGFLQSTYGPTDYLSKTRFELGGTYSAKGHQKYRMTLRFDDIKSEDVIYDYYEGSQQKLGFLYQKKHLRHKYEASLVFEDNNRADYVITPGQIFRVYSAFRQKIDFRWHYALNKRWKTRLLLEYRNSHYNGFSVGDGVTRDDDRYITQMRIEYKISKAWKWLAEISAEDNNSNIARYSYYQNIISTGVSGYF